MSERKNQSAPGPQPCPCGRCDLGGQRLGLPDCCGPYLKGERRAPDAQALMRSRYTAFVLGAEPYLLVTWHHSTRPRQARYEPGTKWLGLELRGARQIDDTQAEVEFVARFRVAGRAVRLHERSRFVHEEGCWFYLDGAVV